MRITILGATGNMGRRVIAEALSRGHDVMGVARNREGLSKLPSSVDAQIGDANRIDDVIKLSTGQDVMNVYSEFIARGSSNHTVVTH